MSSQTIPVIYQLKFGTTSQWTVKNPVLLAGEPGIETDDAGTQLGMKLGDGVTLWMDLPYISNDPVFIQSMISHINNDALHTPVDANHDHDNKAVLDQFGEANGQPTYNNQIIYTQPAIIDGGTF